MANQIINQNNNGKTSLPMEVKYEVNGETIELNATIVRDFLTNGDGEVTDQDIILFLNLCKFSKLNPFLKECYLIKYKSKNPQIAPKPATMVVSKEAFMKRADSNKEYEGKEDGVFVLNRNGDLVKREGSLVLPNETLVGGYCTVFRKGFKPTYVSVSYNEYVGKDGFGKVNSMWNSKSATMIRKVAVCQALREAFPQTYAGLYSEEEINNESTQGKIQKVKEYDVDGVVTEATENKPFETNVENNVIVEGVNLAQEQPNTYNGYDNQYQQNQGQNFNGNYEQQLNYNYNENNNNGYNNQPQVFEIDYRSGYLANKEMYNLIPNSYNKETKTCRVTIKPEYQQDQGQN